MKRLRRSMLFVPGNNPGMIRDAHIYGSDSIMFDLEDSVSINEKDAARFLVYNALSNLKYGNKELVVRKMCIRDSTWMWIWEATRASCAKAPRCPRSALKVRPRRRCWARIMTFPAT